MTVRTTQKTVSFRRPFVLEGLEEALPAGDYDVETEEELVEGVSYAAYRRTATVLLLPAAAGSGGNARALSLDPAALDAALERDQLAAGASPDCAPQGWNVS